MNLFLVSEQRGKYGLLTAFLQKELPAFVHKHASVRDALVKGGKVSAQTPSAAVEGHLKTALEWGKPPIVMVMSRTMFVGSDSGDDWYGSYDPKKKTIVLHKTLVTQWQKSPADKILHRGMITVMLHELVHFLNHEVDANTTVHSEAGHLKDTFQKEAFEPAPLSWEPAHHMMIKEILQSKGVD
jgi:hypothetical protein